jgi:hypothetical protein
MICVIKFDFFKWIKYFNEAEFDQETKRNPLHKVDETDFVKKIKEKPASYGG